MLTGVGVVTAGAGVVTTVAGFGGAGAGVAIFFTGLRVGLCWLDVTFRCWVGGVSATTKPKPTIAKARMIYSTSR